MPDPVEIVAAFIDPGFGSDDEYDGLIYRQAQKALAALSEVGWALYRPEDCRTMSTDGVGWWTIDPPGPSPAGTYHLVPVKKEN